MLWSPINLASKEMTDVIELKRTMGKEWLFESLASLDLCNQSLYPLLMMSLEIKNCALDKKGQRIRRDMSCSVPSSHIKMLFESWLASWWIVQMQVALPLELYNRFCDSLFCILLSLVIVSTLLSILWIWKYFLIRLGKEQPLPRWSDLHYREL